MRGLLLFGGGVTGEPRPTHPSELVHNAWRHRQYQARLQEYFRCHAYPELAELEVARQVERGPLELDRLRAWWALDAAGRAAARAALEAPTPSEVACFGRARSQRRANG